MVKTNEAKLQEIQEMLEKISRMEDQDPEWVAKMKKFLEHQLKILNNGTEKNQ